MRRSKLKEFRKAQHLTQEQMAERLGISKSHYRSVELGWADPGRKLMEKFAATFEVEDVWGLFKRDEKVTNNER